MNNLNELNVLIIGCGNIAGFLDMNRKVAAEPITHAGAFSLNPNFKVSGCMDSDPSKLEKFSEFWGIDNKYNSFEDIVISKQYYDVICICSPTDEHIKNIFECLSLAPKLIFCEKPISNSLEEVIKINSGCKELGILHAVKYTRRWDEDIIRLKSEIDSNSRGSIRSVVTYYNKGILNNGSHILDFLNFLIGDIKVKFVSDPIYDFFTSDPTVCVTLEGKSSIPILMVPAANASDFSLLEMQIIFQKGMVSMLDGGLKWVERDVEDSDIFEGYKTLNSGTERKGKYLKSMSNAVDNIWRTLSQGDSLNSTADTAIAAHNLCDIILQKKIN